jgi:hypothetical protein
MKNQPSGPGCVISFLAFLSIAFISVVHDFSPDLTPAAIALVIMCALAFWEWTRKIGTDYSPEELESAEVMNALWNSDYYVSIHGMVAEERKPGVYCWKPGWNLERFQREYGDLVEQARRQWREVKS